MKNLWTNFATGTLLEIYKYYKIIYKEVAEGILITDVFDTRQDPAKINDEKRNFNE